MDSSVRGFSPFFMLKTVIALSAFIIGSVSYLLMREPDPDPNLLIPLFTDPETPMNETEILELVGEIINIESKHAKHLRYLTIALASSVSILFCIFSVTKLIPWFAKKEFSHFLWRLLSQIFSTPMRTLKTTLRTLSLLSSTFNRSTSPPPSPRSESSQTSTHEF